MAMVVAMGIIEAENSAVISAKNGMVDICKVVAGDNGLAPISEAPHLIAQRTAARLWFKFESLLLERRFFGRFDHWREDQMCTTIAHL
jgi:hypothetical protein